MELRIYDFVREKKNLNLPLLHRRILACGRLLSVNPEEKDKHCLVWVLRQNSVMASTIHNWICRNSDPTVRPSLFPRASPPVYSRRLRSIVRVVTRLTNGENLSHERRQSAGLFINNCWIFPGDRARMFTDETDRVIGVTVRSRRESERERKYSRGNKTVRFPFIPSFICPVVASAALPNKKKLG